jgi:cobalt/nickel transport system permease protein
MHIADGILSTKLCVVADVVAAGSVYWLGRKLEPLEISRMGLLAASAFTVSLVHFPLGAASVHLGLLGFVGILLGKRAFPVICAMLLFQALIFQHGGLLSVGINAINMGLGSLAGGVIWAVRWAPDLVRSFLAGFAGTVVPAVLMALEFNWSGYGKGFFVIAALYVAVAAVEGTLTVFMMEFLKRAKPEILTVSEVRPSGRA